MQKPQVEATSNQQLSARLPLPSVSHVIASSSSQISSNYSYPNSSKPTNSTYFNESPNSNNQTASIAQAVAQRDSSSLQVNPSNYRICSNNIPTSTSATAVFQQFNSPTLLDSSSNISKENLTDEYRELKKLFKHLVYVSSIFFFQQQTFRFCLAPLTAKASAASLEIRLMADDRVRTLGELFGRKDKRRIFATVGLTRK